MERVSAIANVLIFIALVAFIANSLLRLGLFFWEKNAI